MKRIWISSLLLCSLVWSSLAVRAADEKPAAAPAAKPSGTKPAATAPSATPSSTKPADAATGKKKTKKSDEEKQAAEAAREKERKEREARVAELAKQAEERRLATEKAAKMKAEEDARKAAEKKAADEKKAAEEAAKIAAKKAEDEKKAREAAEKAAKLKAEEEAKAAAKALADKLKAEEDARKAAQKAITDRGDAILKIKISRSPDEVFAAVARMAAGADKQIAVPEGDPERYQLYLHAGEWEKLGALIASYPNLGGDWNNYQTRMYTKIVGDMIYASPKAVLLPSDVLRLADACPTPLDERQMSALGKLLAQSIPKTDSRAELLTILRKGTKRLGGDDAEKRHATARVLAAAEFWNEAKEFGLSESELPAVAAVANNATPEKLAEQVWDQSLAVLRDAAADADARKKALDNLYQAMVQATPQATQTRLGSIIRDAQRRDLAWEVLALIGRKASSTLAEVDYATRQTNLELQQQAIRFLGEAKLLGEPAAATFANLFARNWLTEAANTLANHANWRAASEAGKIKFEHVKLEPTIAAAPSGAWLAALAPPTAASVKQMSARLMLVSDNLERLLPLLEDFVKQDRAMAADLAAQYLLRWAKLHDPNFTPEALKQYKLEGHAIVLTRAEQEESLRSLGALLNKLDDETKKFLDEAMLVQAFDLCHSKAEPYTRDQVVKVFGPIEKISPSLLLSLVEQMRMKLGKNWRDLSVQRDAATKRDSDDVFRMVNDGYTEAEKIVTAWLAAHPQDWQMGVTAGSLMSDWAEFAYFQAVVSETDKDRFKLYLERTAEAMKRFRAGAKAYAAAVPKLKRNDFTLLPYRAWFNGLLGIALDSGVNLRKGVTKEGLEEIRTAMNSLPGGAGPVHLGLFSTMVADNVKNNVIAPEMKYRYLSSAVQITGRQETTYPAAEKVQYYESLLSEIRLSARIDGSDKIRTRGPFGVFVTLVHTDDLAREAGGFGKYLQNEVRRTFSGRTVTEQPFYRDRFEESLRLALEDFFTIKAIVFADPQAGARDLAEDKGAKTDGRRWQETPLAYLHLEAKDATVDRMPPFEIELDFYDRDGKVVIPVPSTPALIDIADDATAVRPVANIEITEIVDAREMVPEKGEEKDFEPRLKLDVVANADGLIPDIKELLDLDKYPLPVLEIDQREGLLVRELKSDADGLRPKTERSWTVHFDPAPLRRGAAEKIDFTFPATRRDDMKVAFRTYKDMDPVEAAQQVTLVEGENVAGISTVNYGRLLSSLVGGAIGFAVLMYFLLRKKPEVVVQAPLFVVPREATPFAVAALLHRIRNSDKVSLSTEQKQQLYGDLVALERTAFADGANGHGEKPTRELETLAKRWVEVAT
jgi:hypothetical protein